MTRCFAWLLDFAELTSPSFFNDPDHWRRRANEARLLAEQMDDECRGERMLSIADGAWRGRQFDQEHSRAFPRAHSRHKSDQSH
jgi:hypothetical protein